MKFIVVYPYPFGDFMWRKLELDELDLELDVEVWDLSSILHKKFSKKIFAHKSHINRIEYFFSFFSFFKYIKKFYLSNQNKNIYILNMVSTVNFPSLLVKLIFIYYRIKQKFVFIETINNGWPVINRNYKSINHKIYSKLKNLDGLKSLYLYIRNLFYSQINNLLPDITTHVLVAGSAYNKMITAKKSKKSKIVNAHSIDYSEYIRARFQEKTNRPQIDKNAFLLDSPDPYYSEDRVINGLRSHLTNGVWYPSLNFFFEHVEREFDVQVSVLGHYKSDFPSPSVIFGNRSVFYHRTLEKIAGSKFVISRASTAVSFAVILRKPILFIFSRELMQDNQEMTQIFSMAEQLGTTPININEPFPNLKNYLSVDLQKYRNYENMYLTSANLEISNYQIIIKEIVQLN